MEINAANLITLEDILIGDVWVCSGQSNMVLPMNRVQDRYAEVIAQANNPAIRQFLVPMSYDFESGHEDLPSGHWQPADSENILQFSATGYFFAKSLFEKYQIPIGLINASVGGSPAEAWLSEDGLKSFPDYLETAIKFRDHTYVDSILKSDKSVHDAWYQHIKQLDRGYVDRKKPWFDPGYDASSWETMPIPSYWADEGLGDVNGIVWFRKEINIPKSMTGKPARLLMGRIVDSDSCYINGIFIGTTSYQYPPRKYRVSENLLKPGKNVLVVRVINQSGKGGFIKDKPYQLIVEGQILDLKGDWQYKVGAVVDSLPPPTFIQWKPLGLYNGMITPLLNYKIKGVIWYQGESNTEKPLEYRKLFPALISDWRRKWNLGNFPFLYVQLANFMEVKSEPSESKWAELREAQLKTLSVAGTAMAVTIDIGEWNDIHPLNKEDVGKRLALAAQKLAYGDNRVVYSGPIYQSMRTEKDKIIISFTHTGSGLMVKGGSELKYFAIAGADRKFLWAKTMIMGDQVVVWNEAIAHPVTVRYAWADNPEGANLFNKEGLPASPFSTDE